MRNNWVFEDKLPPKLSVWFSRNINVQIAAIEAYNRNNVDGITQWRDYLRGIKDYLSNPVIAWDNMDRY